MTPRLELKNISKRYPGVVANDGISLSVMPGEIHAVLGENGAGKSTLMRIIYGASVADEGELYCDGELITAHSPTVARALGIEMVYQHFALFESVSVVENIALVVDQPFDLPALSTQVRDLSARYGLPIDPEQLVHNLSVGERQRVEIVRCLMQEPKLLILDEPTSVLTPQAISKLFDTLRLLASEGCSILYISHKLPEVIELCDAATVLRNGRVTGTAAPKSVSVGDLARMMVGSEVPETRVEPKQCSESPILEVRNLTAVPDHPFGTRLDDISFEVYGGEIVGIAGVSGNGQAELIAHLSGERTTANGSSIFVSGDIVDGLDPGRRRDRGIAFVPEERLGRGAVPPHTLSDNSILTGYRQDMVRRGFLKRGKANAYARRVIEKFSVKANGPANPAQSLSGGNLQKFIVGRELELRPQLMLVSQPTWGVDVGAAVFIRQMLIDLSRSGAAVLVISEELEELFEICDRLLVICEGRISKSLDPRTTDFEQIGLLMTGPAGNEDGDGEEGAAGALRH